ncbi:AAA family ATPase [uncultured Pseudomonas sp.]|uniref:AAA family ATPase n=1 Tax=uncultured Pseudomonas sp. TaxID=114707 RepID=UPI0025EEBB94|nr:AAA family ATPase [uncultured Pseudomonas sp.]
MILAVAATKGGEGKTTIGIQVAIKRALAGRKVLLVDGDRQRTAEIAIANRAVLEIEPIIGAVNYPDGATLRSQVKLQSQMWDDIIIDVGGRDSTALRAALVVCDQLLVPFRPRSFSVWALTDIAALIDEANSYRDQPLTGHALLNFADPVSRPADNKEAVEALDGFPQLQYLPTSLGDRKAFAQAAGMGLCVDELAAQWRNPQAMQELDDLVSMLF